MAHRIPVKPAWRLNETGCGCVGIFATAYKSPAYPIVNADQLWSAKSNISASRPFATTRKKPPLA